MTPTGIADKQSPAPNPGWADRLLAGEDPRAVALAYLLLLTLAEALTVFVAVRLGVFLHLTLLFLLMLHAAATWQQPVHRLLLGLAFVPLIRVVSLSLPLVDFPLVYWYFITSVPLFLSALVVMGLLGFSWRDVILRPTALRWPGWLLQIAIGLSGLGLGYVEYLILRPEPLVDAPTLGQIWLPALILLVSTGYMEELIFRRVMQRTAVEQFGPAWGILYVALFFAVLHIGYKSLVDFLFVLVVGLAFGVVVHRTRHLLGVTLAHGLTNIALFLLMPFWIGDSEAPLLPLVRLGPGAAAEIAAVLPAGGPTPLSQTGPSLPTRAAPAAVPALASTSTPAPAAPATPTLDPRHASLVATAVGDGGRLIEHVVQPGQYLRLIARMYETTMETLQALNGLDPASVIHPGDVLLVPVPAGWTRPTATPAPDLTLTTYVVQYGDTLWGLAQAHETTVEAIVEANGLASGHRLYPGQTLLIPASGAP